MLYNKTRPKNIQSIDTILRENYEELIRIHCKQQLKCQINLLSKVDSSIDQEKLKDLIQYFECDTNEKIVSLDEMMLNHLNEIPKSFDMTTELSSDYKWFYQDDTEQSNTSFNTIADWQLIHFMNNPPLIDVSFVQFINDLPAESVSNPIYYKLYSSLSDIPAISIRIRAKVLYPFNLLLENLVSMIDCSLLPRQSVLIDKILAGRIYMLYPMKFRLFNETLANTEIMSSVDVPTINFDPVQANSTSPHGQYTMFHQAYKQLHSLVHELSRSKYDRLWLAQYLGMYSIDQDGPYRDSISCICDDICSTRLPLFILCPNRRTNSGRNRDRWISNVFPVWYDTRFEGISEAGEIYEVVPGDQKIPITASYFKEYCKIYRQIEFIRQGLYSIIPGYFLSLFTAIELEEVVYGKGKMDMDLLKRNTIYGEHYNQNSLCIQYFWTCFKFHLYSGIRAGGGIGDELESPNGDPLELYRIVFDITFFFFIIVILLAIIQGLIIDAFGDLREQLDSVKETLETKCFICGIGQDYFDKEPHGFETHTQAEHNFANYMFFLTHLLNKPDTEHTGQESYVWEMYQSRKWDFFPIGDCFRRQYESGSGGTSTES
ncbi:unnamed protein product [Rotaria sp. Silwood2]|nr:unnamed protein product [Rotaria sp. Silwood2]